MKIAIPKVQSLSLFLAAAFVLLAFLLPLPASAAGEQVDVCGDLGSPADCNNFVDKYLNPLVIVLTALVGIAAVLSIIIAGIQYSSSADDPGTVTKAKQRIFNTILGLVAYVFLLAFLNYLIPGGVFR